ncbi:PulJ/GspJ family protein [[Clostridium] dakarense]|uniref:PulJ/GspJ family protein n=1 Tax=Faecalimicrobium dakarense TaxID=1301100 RepID=UPI0004B1E9FB|nr:type II secretion system protein [[Clostridium] dakarense]
MKNNTNEGFTLLELLVSLAIITLIMFAFFRILNTTIRVNTKNDRDIKALNVAQTEIENLRKQIKNKPLDNRERRLIIYNDSNQSKDKSEEILFNNDKSKKEYSHILINENGSKNKYNITLDIERKLIQGNKKYNNSNMISSSFNDYEYNIDINVELEDKYFSKKDTSLEGIRILASSSNLSEDNENQDGDDSHTPKPLSEYHIRIHTTDDWDLDKPNESFKVANETTISSNQVRSLGPENISIKNDKIKIQYMPDGILNGNPFMQMDIINRDETHKVYKEYGFSYNDYDYIDIYIEHTGMQLNDLIINGEKIDKVNKNIRKKIDKSKKGITLEFNGGIKLRDGDISGPNSSIRSDIFIAFSK